MFDGCAIAEQNMEAVAMEKQLALKGGIEVAPAYCIGGIYFLPVRVFSDVSTMTFAPGWYAEPAMILPKEHPQVLHRRVSSTDPKEKESFLLPARFFVADWNNRA